MTSNQKHRVFQPVILFHDHSFQPLSGVTHRIHIPIGDPYYTPLIEQKKNQVGIMLETNGKAWFNIIQSSRQQSSSPKPSHCVDRRRRTQLLLQQYGSNKNNESDEDEEYTSTSTEESDKPQTRKRRGNLPKSVTAVLKQWLIDHCKNPYPTEAEKTSLKDKTGLTLNQISNWFINARRRLLPQILDDHQHEQVNDPIPTTTTTKRKRRPDQQQELVLSPSPSAAIPSTHVLRKRRKYTKKHQEPSTV